MSTMVSQFSAQQIVGQEVQLFQRALPAVSHSSCAVLVMDSADSLVKMSVGAGAYMTIGGASGFGSLDLSYDGAAGSGAGRTITADSGAVVITSAAADNNNVLEITKNPVGAQAGLGFSVTMGATTTGIGGSITASGAGACLTMSAAAAGVVVMSTAATAAVNASLTTLSATTFAGGGPTGHLISRSVTTTTAVTCTSPLLRLTNNFTHTAGGGVNLTLDGNLLTISHASTYGGAGTIADTTTAIGITMTPGIAYQAVNGITMGLGAFTNGNGVGITHTGQSNGAHGLRIVMDAWGAYAGGGAYGALIRRDPASDIVTSQTLTNPLLWVDNVPNINGGLPGQVLTMNGNLVAITHTPGAPAGGATHVDSTIGLSIAMTPSAAGANCRGIVITMGANNDTVKTAVPLNMDISAANRDVVPYIVLGPLSIYCDTGVPANGNGNDGDLYIRYDTTVAGLTHLYHRNGGAWIGIA